MSEITSERRAGDGQDTERQILWRILQKLPDEHAIRAIELG
ncbi:MAG: hypothetical protein ABR992_18690 [Solirubrobacteraceae bacterium]|jgi:hypothetical protein